MESGLPTVLGRDGHFGGLDLADARAALPPRHPLKMTIDNFFFLTLLPHKQTTHILHQGHVRNHHT